MDGTMVDNTPYHFKAWQTLFKKYDKGELNKERYKAEISGVPIMDTVRILFPDADDAFQKAIAREKEQLYQEYYTPYVKPVSGLENLLIELKDAGVKLAMASSASMHDIDFVLNHVPVRQYFDVIIDGDRVSKGKPNPQIFLKAAADLHMRPEDCIVFEDSMAGIKAGNAAGMKVVGVTTAHTADGLQPSSLVVKDYTELSLQKLQALFRP
ncbi:beta-phosphoglucomutase family hydrolase [Mucilaginibacter panaciglaebae]|uniref:Beta-phosphoglucomutase family hydrolase n=2 Tax=Mucilaginibacter panaciglaebae TaxID=502331 RepID=A0ABP7WN23_9SPHI